jgi:hypothetical protein
MKAVLAFVTYSHRKGTTQPSATIMESTLLDFLSLPITAELQMSTTKAMTTNTNCQ